MRRVLLFLITALLIGGCRKAQVSPTVSSAPPIPWADSSARHPRHTALTALLEKYRRKGLPGISLLVHDASGTWTGSTGMADVENGVPFAPGQVSKVASVTKLFMGVLAFRLMEDSAHSGLGYAALDKPITTWLPARITDKLPNGKIITWGDCMKHETGVPDIIKQSKFYLEVLNNPNKKWEAEELLSYIYNEDAVFAPRDTAIYSNTNTILSALVIEYATGRKHSDLLKEYILQPLGLHNTYYQPHDALPGNVAQGYYDLYNNGTIVNVSNFVTGSGNGYGGLYSNVFDLYTFLDALLLKKTLLSATSLSRMQTWGVSDGINRYGYGIMRKFTDREPNAGIGHSGRDLGYSANLFYFPAKGVTHAFVINYGSDAESKLRDVFYEFQNELLDLTLQ